MKITRRQIRRIIREALDPEYMREEIMSFAEETDAEGVDVLLDIIGAPPLAGDDEASIDAAFDVIDKHVTGSYPEDLAYIHQELTNAGYFG
tara:strand:- start:94 stop:366 length:273 start_codon:yes stop_codon:yes gene_type:complete